MKKQYNPWQEESDLVPLVKKLDYQFRDLSLLKQSLTHTSYAHENKIKDLSNERLEFLGDSVLDLVVSEYLFVNFADKNEGELSKIRSALVNEDIVAEFSQFLSLGDFLLLGKGEEQSGGRRKVRNLARVFEALLGAIYLDADYITVHNVFLSWVKKFEQVEHQVFTDKILDDFDPKTKLQIEVLKHSQNPPRYTSTEVENHVFEVSLWIFDEKVLSKKGLSKKKVEKQLAAQALKEKRYFPKGEQNAS